MRNEYEAQVNGIAVCLPCSTCVLGQGVRRECSAREDTVCDECAPGRRYSRDINGHFKCIKCTKCLNRHVKFDCTPTSDATCGSCKKGTKKITVDGTVSSDFECLKLFSVYKKQKKIIE